MSNLPTFEEFEQRKNKEGYEQVLVREWGPNVANDQHTHDFDASGLVVQGEMWIECADRTLHMLPGESFELARGTPHSERYGPEGAVYWAARRSVPVTAG
jgi:quercetin dioxygenase-like cupin family protein